MRIHTTLVAIVGALGLAIGTHAGADDAKHSAARGHSAPEEPQETLGEKPAARGYSEVEEAAAEEKTGKTSEYGEQAEGESEAEHSAAWSHSAPPEEGEEIGEHSAARGHSHVGEEAAEGKAGESKKYREEKAEASPAKHSAARGHSAPEEPQETLGEETGAWGHSK